MTERDRRALQLGLTAVVAAFVLLRALPTALRAERALRERVAAQASALGQLKADLAALPALEDSAAAVNRALSQLGPRLVTGRSRTEGAAELTVLLRSLAEGLGVRVERIVPVADSTAAGPLMRVVVRLEAETDTKGVGALLTSIARQTTVLDVVSLRVLALEPSSARTVAERLRVELTVYGWVMHSSDAAEEPPT